MNTHLHDLMSQHLSSAIAKEISVTYHDNHIPDCMTELPVVANNIILPAFEMPTDENASRLLKHCSESEEERACFTIHWITCY